MGDWSVPFTLCVNLQGGGCRGAGAAAAAVRHPGAHREEAGAGGGGGVRPGKVSCQTSQLKARTHVPNGRRLGMLNGRGLRCMPSAVCSQPLGPFHSWFQGCSLTSSAHLWVSLAQQIICFCVLPPCCPQAAQLPAGTGVLHLVRQRQRVGPPAEQGVTGHLRLRRWADPFSRRTCTLIYPFHVDRTRQQYGDVPH